MYGIKNEPLAAKKFSSHVKENNLHSNFDCKCVGLIISITHPFLAASPDRICHCECHGKFVLEIKCPFRVSGLKIKEYSLKNKDFFLKVNHSTDNMYLEKDHEYYYQIQLQIFVAECREAVLAVFNGYQDMEYVTIKRDEELIEKMISKGKLFFLRYLLPELISKRFSSAKILPNSVLSSTASTHPTLNQFIYSCQDNTKTDETVSCSSELCVIKIYHKKCTKSIRFPTNWMCVSCKKETAKLKRLELKKNREKATSTTSLNNETQQPLPTAVVISNGKRYSFPLIKNFIHNENLFLIAKDDQQLQNTPELINIDKPTSDDSNKENTDPSALIVSGNN